MKDWGGEWIDREAADRIRRPDRRWLVEDDPDKSKSA
jgi:hypothetical protein